MKASEAPFIKLLQTDAQFIIPIYQRTYSWTVKQCQQLWDDIVRAGKDDSSYGHFIGSVVYIEDPGPVTTVDKLLVIDGQQRLTTLTLLLIALRNRILEVGNQPGVKLKQIEDYFLFNQAEEGSDRYKLALTQADRETLLSLLDREQTPANHSRRLTTNLTFFEGKLKEGEASLEEVFAGVRKLLVVDVALDPHRDNPQLIFESLNSTGLALTQADLIRNYVLMGLPRDEQESLYKHHWQRMEEAFGHAQYAEHFDSFMRHYLTLKLGRIPRISDVYVEFKGFAESLSQPLAVVVADVHRYARHFVNIALEREPDKRLREVLHDINTLRVDVAYPFLLELYDDYVREEIGCNDLYAALRLVEAYVVRRAICGIPTNSLNKTFQTFSIGLDKQRYLESIRAKFQLLESYRRFPNDEEFKREFALRDIYNLTARRNYILRKLENFGSKEAVNVEAFTIEHVLPQNERLSEEWKVELGPEWKRIRDTYLHTIGNLTLTGYNAELGDRPFKDKRDMPGGFRDSPVGLNKDLAKLETWNEATILERAQRLSERATDVWEAPQLKGAELENYRNSEREARSHGYGVEDHQHLAGPMLDLWSELRQRILNLDSSVSEEILKLYIAYKTSTNFVDVVPQKNALRLTLNMAFDDVDDPEGWCQDVTDLGRWGNGDVEFKVAYQYQLDYAMELIRQSFLYREKKDELAQVR